MPEHLDAAVTMRSATSRRQLASLYAPGNTTWQHSCSHSTAICNQRFNYRIELRTHDSAVIAEHRGGTNRAWFDRSRNRRTPEVPFIAGRSHFTRKNTRFRAQLSPKTKPMQHPCRHYTMRFAPSRLQPASLYAHGNTTWQHSCSHSTAICNPRFQITL